MGWRDDNDFEVHPAADVFPVMPDDELDALAADIKANGVRTPLSFFKEGDQLTLADGRNRLEAMERAGVEEAFKETLEGLSPAEQVAFIISKNIKRRHLTKQEQADLIVAALKAGQKPTQDGSVSRGGRGKVNPVKQEAIAAGKEHGISKGTIGRALAKAEGKKPKPKSQGLFAALERELRRTKPKPVELPNTGCNYDPDDPRGEEEGEPIEVTRRRAWLYMAAHAQEQAEWFLAKDGHRAIAKADPSEVDMEVVIAVLEAAETWTKVAKKLQEVSGLSDVELGQELLKRGWGD